MPYLTFQYQKELNVTEYQKIYRFNERKKKTFICLTTDLFLMYRDVFDEIGFLFINMHISFVQTIPHKLKGYCRKNKINGKERDYT